MTARRTYIQFPVPEEHLPNVIALLAELDRDLVQQTRVSTPETLALTADLVARMYWDSEDRHRQLIAFLAAHPEEWFFTSELARALGVPTGNKGMAGVFGAFGRRAKHRYGGAKPWEMAWDPAREEARYRMNEGVARFVKEASS